MLSKFLPRLNILFGLNTLKSQFNFTVAAQRVDYYNVLGI